MTKLEIFDHSMISGFRLCPKRFFHRYLEHLDPIDDPKFVPAFGSAGHEALDCRYKGGEFNEQVDKFVKYWSPFEGKDPKKNRTLARGLQILEEYDRKFPLDKEPFKIHNNYVEVGFSAELQGYIICGKMDGIVEWRVGFKGLVILEHKFSGSKGYLITEPNHQLDTYIWGARQLIGEPIVGALLNQIYHTRSNKKEGYYNDFEREFTERNDDAIKLWEQDTLAWIEDINVCIKKGQWRRNPSSCGAFWRACPYIPLCKPGMRLNQDKVKEQLYTINPWEPYPKARKEGGYDD